jgi:beta-lactamase class A
MRKLLPPLSLLFFLCVGFNHLFAQSKLQNLNPEIESLIRNSHAETVAVAVYDLNSKQQFLLNERMNFHAASTMKLPVMMELFRATNRLNFNQPILVKNSFSSLVDGSEYQLSPDDDSDAELYQKIGQPVPMRELIQRMITRSSNLATNILIEQAKAENVMKLMKTLGANDIQVRRGVEDNKAFRAGLNNTTTAYDLMLLLKVIAEKKLMKAAACDAMISILSEQEFNEGIPAGISKGTKIAHKTGSITKIYHDAAIVFPPKRKPYIIVVLTRGFEKEAEAHQLVAEISRVIWEDFNAKVQRAKEQSD